MKNPRENRVINKWVLPAPNSMQAYNLAAPAKIVHIGMQQDYPHFWVEIPTQPERFATVEIYTVGTGWGIPNDTDHIGTVIDAGGFVWHFYARWPSFVRAYVASDDPIKAILAVTVKRSAAIIAKA